MKLKDIINTLELLKDEYDSLKLLIADQINDNQITEADFNFKKLLELKDAIKQMDNTEFVVKNGG